MSIENMYKLTGSMSTQWGIEGYHLPVNHVDAARQIKDREYLEQKKGGKNKGYITKKYGVFDLVYKINKDRPGPGAYNIESEFHGPPKDQKKINKKNLPGKKSYIEMIISEQEKRPKPGIKNFLSFSIISLV